MSVELNNLNVGIILVIFILTYIGIIHQSFDKTLAAVLGAMAASIAIIYMKIQVDNPHLPGEFMDATEAQLIHFEDLSIIGLIFGTLILVEVSQEAGVFHYLSVNILKATKGDPKKLLRYFGALTMILSALVNNISAMMIVGSLTLIACERLELDPKPYIITELSMTTVGGIMTLISSVPNIIVAQIFGLTFTSFLIIGAPFAIIAMILNFMIFEYLFRNDIPVPSDPKINEAKVNEFDPWGAVTDKNLFYKSIFVLTLTIFGFVFSAQLGLSLAVIAISGAVLIVLVSGIKIDEIMSRLDWGLIAFFLGLFVLIQALALVDILAFIAEKLTEILPNDSLTSSIILLWFISIISGVVDNIVVAAAFGPILFEVANNPDNPLSPDLLAWAMIFGANFGGGLTPIGAPSAVVGLALLYRKTGEKIGWGEFIKTQGLATFVRLIFTSFYLWFLHIFVL
ncbi:MAG: Arsenical pump membrane protein [Candidatus Heimdallarchaeota archaeon LC_2]|nr:MAG: Arsenical pump membrane protein [Candidatus Heimdallarchaeota archaeon LC_2]